MKIITFGAGQLTKCSASKVYYLRRNPDKAYQNTERNLKGNEYAEKVSKGIKELTGCYDFITDEKQKIRIYYPFDEIRIKGNDRIFIEHKMIDDIAKVEPWFLESSVVQLAFMMALHKVNTNRFYKTSRFRMNETGEYHQFEFNDTEDGIEMFVLNFGGRKFEIEVDAQPIVDYFIKKAIASMYYNQAKMWDEQNRYKDYENIKQFITLKDLACTTTKAPKKTTEESKRHWNLHLNMKIGKGK